METSSLSIAWQEATKIRAFKIPNIYEAKIILCMLQLQKHGLLVFSLLASNITKQTLAPPHNQSACTIHRSQEAGGRCVLRTTRCKRALSHPFKTYKPALRTRFTMFLKLLTCMASKCFGWVFQHHNASPYTSCSSSDHMPWAGLHKSLCVLGLQRLLVIEIITNSSVQSWQWAMRGIKGQSYDDLLMADERHQVCEGVKGNVHSWRSFSLGDKSNATMKCCKAAADTLLQLAIVLFGGEVEQ